MNYNITIVSIIHYMFYSVKPIITIKLLLLTCKCVNVLYYAADFINNNKPNNPKMKKYLSIKNAFAIIALLSAYCLLCKVSAQTKTDDAKMNAFVTT